MNPRAAVVLSVPGCSLSVEPQFGGRLSSWLVDGHELLWQPDLSDGAAMPGANHPFGWGSFVMAPYAGRIRNGKLAFDGVSYELPLAMAPHAIHGTVYDVPWEVDEVTSDPDRSHCQLSVDLRAPWPFAGRLVHRITLMEGAVRQELELRAVESMPATLGWHPWFPRTLNGATGPVEWSFAGSNVSMMQRDEEGITTATLVPVPEGPWDDCFVGIGEVTVRWPGLLEIVVSHDCPYMVLFDGLDHAVCVEPQTGPPNAVELTGEACRTEAGMNLSASMTWSWRRL
jgi:aldose 1-epimerase